MAGSRACGSAQQAPGCAAGSRMAQGARPLHTLSVGQSKAMLPAQYWLRGGQERAREVRPGWPCSTGMPRNTGGAATGHCDQGRRATRSWAAAAAGPCQAVPRHALLPRPRPAHSLVVDACVVWLRAGGLGGRDCLAGVVAAVGGRVAESVGGTRLYVAACRDRRGVWQHAGEDLF